MLRETKNYVNLSKSGKAITISVDEPGFFTIALSSIDKLKTGEIDYTTLTEIIKEVEE